MGKLIILSLEESEQSVYDKIMKIVDEAGISMEEKSNFVFYILAMHQGCLLSKEQIYNSMVKPLV